METDRKNLLLELCHIAVLRNRINTRRHQGRYRKNYYINAVRVVEAFKGSNYELRDLEHKLHWMPMITAEHVHAVARVQARIAAIKDGMQFIVDRYKDKKKPKWVAMGLHKLRSLALKGEADYAMAKHETMEFSIQYRARVKYLVNALNCNLFYDNGAITRIVFSEEDFIGLEQIDANAVEYELREAVENMIQE